MRVLILGGSGMLGHKLWQTLAPSFDTYATVRRAPEAYSRFGIFDEARVVGGVSAENFETIERAFATVRPEAVVNCIGIVKQDAAATNPIASITVNALFPHQLAQACGEIGARLIHLSTDCVFSGAKGNYSESAAPDAQDLYGRTKLLGEVGDRENCLTLRTSMIGRELQGAHGLVEWFLSQRGKTVRGFKRAVFSGFTTTALAGVIGDLVANHPELSGVWHVAAEPINKFDLLVLVQKALALDIEIEPDENFFCDRSLDGTRFRAATEFAPQPWPEMIDRMAQDTTPYDEIRRNDAG
ncbi:MAG TPA: NAD(P)-dependent oxidoreductase [Blastocatellia bacterium]|nr:NAD(P)-dependent oxidoreductase [Blastocatellia bacterium]